jgi:rRNA maturation protein Nop10
MPGAFHVERLSDEFGQYTLALTCAACGYERQTTPKTLGRLCGWDARLDDVARRMRCSKCGKKACKARAIPPKKPRGYSSLPK